MFIRCFLILVVLFGSHSGFAASKEDQVRTDVLKLLNQKKNEVRAKILKDRAESCDLFGHCSEEQFEAFEKNTFEFKASDIRSVTPLGNGEYFATCHKLEPSCAGDDEETDEFIVILSHESHSRWKSSPAVDVLRFSFVKATSPATGKVTYRKRMVLEE